MNITSKHMTRNYLHLVGFASVLSLSGCWEVTPNESDVGSGGAMDTESAGRGGTTGVGGAQTGGATLTGGSSQTGGTVHTGGSGQAGGTAQSAGSSATGGSAQTGGTAQTGGMAPTGGVSQAGGRAATGGNAPTGGVPVVQTGGSPATGGSSLTGGAAGSGAATGGTKAAGGTTSTGGTPSTGGTAQAGAAGTASVLEPICNDEGGAPVPYDYSFGLIGEYAFALSMSCDVGGYVMPLVMADPEQLTQVNAFVAEATDWYRAEILKCGDTTTQLGANAYGLLPVSQSSNLSGADFDASMALFLMVVDRHDGQPDAVSAAKKDKIKNRIKSVKARAVHSTTVGLTKTLSEPDCVPAEPAASGG